MPQSKSLIVCLVVLLFAPTAHAGEIRSPVEILGVWELVEWYHDGEVLEPPFIGGRFSIRNGSVIFMAHRESDQDSEYVYGYGSYSIEGSIYSYGYDRYVETKSSIDGVEVWSGSVPQSSYETQIKGTRLLILDVESRSRGLVLDGDRLTWIVDGEPLRAYRRMEDYAE